MRVNAWKNIDVEVEVDVILDDCINEMLRMADEEGAPSRSHFVTLRLRSSRYPPALPLPPD